MGGCEGSHPVFKEYMSRFRETRTILVCLCGNIVYKTYLLQSSLR